MSERDEFYNSFDGFNPNDLSEIAQLMDEIVTEDHEQDFERKSAKLHRLLGERVQVIENFMQGDNRWDYRAGYALQENQQQIRESFNAFLDRLYVTPRSNEEKTDELFYVFRFADSVQKSFNLAELGKESRLSEEFIEQNIDHLNNIDDPEKAKKHARDLFVEYVLKVGWRFYNNGMDIAEEE